MSAVIEFDDVYRHYGRLDVLRGLTFTVRPGEIYALLGRNGSGKTTALRILLGFLAPANGRTTVLGTDSRDLSPDDRGRIGYLGEGHRLYKTMRVSGAIAFEAGTRPRFDRAWADMAVDRLGLPRRGLIARLSRGQRAQLALVFAVAGRPEVLIFDDPAMGLDVVMRRIFLDAMIDLLSGKGVSVLFSSHILTDVERIADRIGILHEGRLIVDARLDEVKRRVQKRRWHPPNSGSTEPPPIDGLLRSRRRSDGVDLTLLDFDAEKEKALGAAGGRLTEPVVPDLEDLFVELTRDDQAGQLPAPVEVKA